MSYWDEDLDDYYFGSRYHRSYYRYKPDYSSIEFVTEWMADHMCCDVGIRTVADFMRRLYKNENDSVAGMYWRCISAEYASARAKYSNGSYAEKEEHLKCLIQMCSSWRDKYSKLCSSVENLEEEIAKINAIKDMKEKKRKNKIAELKNKKHFIFEDEDKELRMKRESSGIYAAQYIYYFKLPGCEQVSYHSNADLCFKNDSMSWDNKVDSTLLKLNAAVCKRYGERLRKEFHIDETLWHEFLKITEEIERECENTLSHCAALLLNSWEMKKLFIKKDDFIDELETSEILEERNVKELSEMLPSGYGDMLIFYSVYKELLEVSKVFPEDWVNWSIALIDKVRKDLPSNVVKENKGLLEVNIGRLKFKLPTLKAFDKFGGVNLFSLDDFKDQSEKFEKAILKNFCETILPDSYQKLIDAEKERKEQDTLSKEKEKKEFSEKIIRSSQQSAKATETYEYLTRSMIKECFLWTDSMIEKFAGQPDQKKPNPHYKCAEPMLLFSRARLLEIEKKPEFVAEMKKSFKRRGLIWNYENDIITH